MPQPKNVRRGFFAWLRREEEGAEPERSIHTEETVLKTDASVRRAQEAPPGPEPEQGLAELASRLVDEGELGKGGMGSVRRVFDTNLQRRVAMKVLAPRFASEEAARDRFLEEAQITGQLEHPNIPPIHELGADDEGTYYFTMKMIQGQTLDAILQDQAFSPGDEVRLYRVLQIFLRVCEALAFAHERGVVHCDLKPANIMVGPHGQVYLMDWGIARLAGAARRARPGGEALVHLDRPRAPDQEGVVEGTPAYMSPEQASGRQAAIDERTDVFCLGAILYRILAGRAPYHQGDFTARLNKAQRAEFTPLEEVVRDERVPTGLFAISARAMRTDPAERYPSVEALQADLEAFLRGEGRAPRKTFPAGALVIREGEPGDAAYVIEKGRCRAFKAAGNLTLREMGPGDVFGEASVFTSGPRSASVEVLEEATVVVVTREVLQQELRQTLWMQQFVTALATRFAEVDQRASLARQQQERPEGKAP